MEVVVLGCRKFGKVHLRALSSLKVPYSIMERNPDVLKDCASTFSPLRTFSSIDEVLRSNADVVDVVLPHNLHRQVVVEALKAGKHVLVEKPIATTVEEGEDMIKASKEYRRKFMVAEQYFFDPTVKAVSSMIREGKLGKVHTIVVRDQRFYDHTGWRTDPTVMGGGALIDGGIHYVDTILNFGGDYEGLTASVSHVGSTLKGRTTRWHSSSLGLGPLAYFYTLGPTEGIPFSQASRS
ncbi:hypothetical protein HS1genome_1546 [Sulfodiicoccus acidiphilus]|uniref:Gfo/Idh/MocA-like oxidoreductase N-terminal domain-containing protein n=1 Tax=Sulfodiicoccus acidiphilus TaxID=1670455 RepID=A0A348B4Q5_9CREN|nr:Gfo/Idh/MocA family oxidoreductase [Sulfodiicoccus acidiphilus]BBD73157.1 hypothetical protein HS1genome_1546 [Sulfodiicoccus acidiphilus]